MQPTLIAGRGNQDQLSAYAQGLGLSILPQATKDHSKDENDHGSVAVYGNK